MNWTKASAVAEIFSSVAILITLVYLVIELQQDAGATQADTRQAMLTSDQQFIELIIASPELNLMQYQPDLTDEERVRASFFLVTFVRMRENNWLQYQSGTLDDVTWQSYQSSIVAALSAPQARAWWENFGVERVFSAEFIALVDELLVDVPLFDQNPHIAAFD